MDADTLNEDWIKTGSWDLPLTLDGLLWSIGAANSDHSGQIAALRHFTDLPAWLACPPELAKQVRLMIGQPQLTTNVSDVRLRLFRYSEDQPRDENGRFEGSGEDKTPGTDMRPLLENW
jgi:hypothetical protein